MNQVLTAPPLKIIDDNFPKQAAFIRGKGKRKAALCTRRAGKSYGIGLYLYQRAVEHEGSTVLYLALTRDSARNIMWKDVLKDINKRHNMGVQFNETLLEARLANGSVIKLAGADASKEEMEKYLGGKYPLIVIDEAGSFRQDLRKLVYENLEPAVADYDGEIVMIGTPTAFTKSLFFDITQPSLGKRELGWEVHSWNTYDNPYMESKWRKRMGDLVQVTPNIVNTPGYRRMYLGEWVTDLDDLVYKFSPDLNSISGLPHASYAYVLGVDLGFNDSSAFVVAAYSFTDKHLYFIEAHKKSKMIVSDVAERIRYYQKRFDLNTIVIDNAAKQTVEELKQRFSLPLTAADKAGKAEFIEIMNSEMVHGLIKLLPEAGELEVEWEDLIWDDKSLKRQEHPGCENHLADAALYAWRHCYQHLSETRVKEDNRNADVMDDWWDEEAERMERVKEQSYWEKM